MVFACWLSKCLVDDGRLLELAVDTVVVVVIVVTVLAVGHHHHCQI